jgi:outer membrane cobalamin receptor
MRRTLVFFVLFSAIRLFGQASPSISGTVFDPDHAAVPDASVRLLSPSGAELGHTLTDQQGTFSFHRQCSGCSVEVALTGFLTSRQPASTAPLEIKLRVAPVQERVIVTANRTETPASVVGTTTTVISKEEIDARQAPMVSDLLQSVPGVTVIRSGGYGASTSLFMRGGESNYTKVLLDGIPLNEPGGAFDFSSLSTSNIDHIEIVRGPQSALFGSDAMTGVVQLFSSRGESEANHPQVSLDLEGGNLGTLNAGANVTGQAGRFDYNAFWSRFSTDNQGVFADFADSTAGANLGWKVEKSTQLRLILRDDLSLARTPGQTAFEPPITDATFHKGDGYGAFSIANQTTEFWNQRLTYTFERSRQVSRDLGLDPPYVPSFEGHTSPFEFFDLTSDFLNDTRRHHIDYQSDFTLGSGSGHYGQHAFTLAFSWDREVGNIGDKLSGAPATHALRDDFGGIVQYQLLIGRLSLTNGFRVEDNSSFGRTVIPRSSAAYLLRQGSGDFGATKLKFNFGLGIKEPSFTQSFSPEPSFLGNPNLRPERTRSFDFGIEQRLLNDRAKVEVNWFDNRFRDLIEFETISFSPFLGTFFNLNASKADGVEVIFETVPCAGLRLTAAYTYLNGRITQSSTPIDPVFGVGQGLLRRPRHSGSFGVNWSRRKLNVNSNLIYVGKRADSDFAGLVPPITSDDSYTRWDLAGSYRFTKHFEYVGSITNVFDRNYMEALGFPALPIAFRTGGRFTF